MQITFGGKNYFLCYSGQCTLLILSSPVYVQWTQLTCGLAVYTNLISINSGQSQYGGQHYIQDTDVPQGPCTQTKQVIIGGSFRVTLVVD